MGFFQYNLNNIGQFTNFDILSPGIFSSLTGLNDAKVHQDLIFATGTVAAPNNFIKIDTSYVSETVALPLGMSSPSALLSYQNNVLFIGGLTGGVSSIAYSIDNGATFTYSNVAAPSISQTRFFATNNAGVIVACIGGDLYTSTDNGLNFSLSSAISGGRLINQSVNYDSRSGLFTMGSVVAGRFMTSVDGVNWTVRNIAVAFSCAYIIKFGNFLYYFPADTTNNLIAVLDLNFNLLSTIKISSAATTTFVGNTYVILNEVFYAKSSNGACIAFNPNYDVVRCFGNFGITAYGATLLFDGNIVAMSAAALAVSLAPPVF